MATFSTVTSGGDDTPGPILFQIKETLVAEGWTVRGSGDGGSRHGDIEAAASVPGAQQGSGGEYDCWTVASTAFSGVAGGAGNTDAWCWLRSPSGDRDLILTSTNDGSTDTHGRVGFSRKGAGGFVGGSTNATTFPAAPAGGSGDEVWTTGSRNNDGGLRSNIGPGTDHHDVIYADGEYFWRLNYYGTSNGQSWSGVFPLSVAHPNDPDPVVYANLRTSSTFFTWWDHVAGAFSAVSLSAQGEMPTLTSTVDGLRVLYPFVVDTNTYTKGTVDPSFLLTCSSNGTHGERVTLTDGRVHLVAQVSEPFHFIVPDDTVTLPGVTMADVDGYNVLPESSTPDSVAPVVTLVSPADDSQIGKNTPIVITITDETALASVPIIAKFHRISVWEVVLFNGNVSPQYNVVQAGNQYTITRAGGWLESPTIEAAPIDTGGNVG